MPSKKDLAKKILQDALDGKPIGEALLARFRKMQGKAKTSPLPPSRKKLMQELQKGGPKARPPGTPRATKNLGISPGRPVSPGREIVHVPRPPHKGGGFTGGPTPRTGYKPFPRGLLPGAATPASTALPGFWDKIGKGLSTGKGKLVAGAGGLVGMLLAMGIKGTVKDRISRGRKAKAIKGLPPATVEAVLRDRRRQQMLATKRGLLARNDPEAFQMLMMGLSGETPQALAQGEMLLGRQPQASPQAAQTVEQLLAAMG